MQLPEPLPYWRPQRAIGWNVYRQQPQDLSMKSSHIQKEKKPKKRTKVFDEAALDDNAEGALPLGSALRRACCIHRHSDAAWVQTYTDIEALNVHCVLQLLVIFPVSSYALFFSHNCVAGR